MATIINQANLTYTYGTTTENVLSNLAVTERTEPLSPAKRTLEDAYRAASDLTYLISLQNNSNAPFTDLTVQDNLGAFTPAGAAAPVQPLTYTGPAELYVNGVFAQTLTPAVTEDGVTFTLPSLPSGSNALILYKARVNGFAPLSQGSEITNTATFTGGAGEPQTVSAAIPVDSYADVSIFKEMTPNPIEDGGVLTATFTIENRGNLAATDLVLVDDFPVPLTNVSVTVNGAAVTDYTFENNRLTLPASGSTQTTLTVPAATFETGAAGAVTIVPGTLVVELIGNI